jgi:hypothetical protein
MSNGVPTPWEIYSILPYQFPLIDFQPVVRIPVVGPEPFNTLVVVRGQVPTTSYRHADDTLQRRKLAVGTNFSLIGFDPRVPPPSQHSTTAALQMMQASDDSAFVIAVDGIDAGFFDDSGRWTLVVRVADLFDEVYAASNAYISSWVLCYEPPPPERPHGREPPIRIAPGARYSVIEQGMADTSQVGVHLQRFIRARQRRNQRRIEACCGPNAPSDSGKAAAPKMSFAQNDLDLPQVNRPTGTGSPDT